MARLTASDIRDIAQNCHGSARENAFVTVREVHGNAAIDAIDGADMHPDFVGFYRASLDGALDSLSHRFEHRTYGAPRPLTDVEIARVRKAVPR